MKKKRKQYSAPFKFGAALEAAKGLNTISQLSSEHGVHANQVSQWKRQLLEEGAALFNHHRDRDERKQEAREAELYEQIGRLKMELEWVKKKAGRFS